jgi:hypothetical protein
VSHCTIPHGGAGTKGLTTYGTLSFIAVKMMSTNIKKSVFQTMCTNTPRTCKLKALKRTHNMTVPTFSALGVKSGHDTKLIYGK